MTVTEAPTSRGPGRPVTDPLVLEAQQLHRCADLAAAILRVMRQEGKSNYDSERTLRQWLQDAGVAFTTADVPAALALLEAKGLLARVPAALGMPRPAWLPSEADKPAEFPAAIRLGRLLLEVCRPGNGKPSRSTAADISERLALADVDISADELAETLRRLVDCGQLVQVRRQESYPMSYAVSGTWAYDVVDHLESEICAVLRDRDELGYGDEDELRQWLADAGVELDDRKLELALGHLWRLGRLQQPRAVEWTRPGARPTWLVDAPVHVGM